MSEIFVYPTIKEVAFEIKFPDLFSVEGKIGEFQEKIISRFPDSKLVLRRHLLLSERLRAGKKDFDEELNPSDVTKIWTFFSKEEIEIRVQTNSVSIISKKHKSYNNPNEQLKFRDTIEFVIGNFLSTINVPIISRIGLRYIDECPLPTSDNDTLKRLYNSSFPTDRFSMNEVSDSYLFINCTRSSHRLIYQETKIKNAQGKDAIVLDFDGFETNIASKDYLQITDELYQIIHDEYFNIVKEPVKQYMRTGTLE